MMKKLLTLSAVATAIMLSGHAFAAGATGPANLPAGGLITPLECASLDNNVTVQTSKNVFAAFNCTTASFTAATCHAAGTNKTTSQTCVWTEVLDTAGASQDPKVYSPNYTACGVTPTTEPKVISYTGRSGYRGGSAGGSVGPVELLKPTCEATTVITLVP